MWPAAVVVILGITVVANVWIITIANNDPSFAVEENYYERGLRWDEELAQRETNARLGWRLLPALSPIVRGSGAGLRVELRDASVRPIADASIVVRAVHIARAGEPVQVTLGSDAQGGYSATVPLERPGLWELRFDVHRGDVRFTALERFDTRLAQP
jgi:nitrogen fixation protein FixH